MVVILEVGGEVLVGTPSFRVLGGGQWWLWSVCVDVCDGGG